MRDFGLQAGLDKLAYLDARVIDFYFSLAGELFRGIRDGRDDHADWAVLGNALASVSRDLQGETHSDAVFFAAVAFYCGGYPASAMVTMRDAAAYGDGGDEVRRACRSLLTRRLQSQESGEIAGLIASIRNGTHVGIAEAAAAAEQQVHAASLAGPDEWVTQRLYASLLHRLNIVNVRAVLPDGGSRRWAPLVESFLDRDPPVWEFFPSQIEAIDAGLLTGARTYSLQMPTGSGKTALTETLLFSHLTDRPDDKAVLLVPYRALARELRHSLGSQLSRMGLPVRTVYGGTVPTPEEADDLVDVRVLIATPESLTGLFGAQPELVEQVSLVVCDEGHLLDSRARGVGLELLLARLRRRTPAPRLVFVSAIVPNIEEINAWLGGSDGTVVRSSYRPAVAEYAVLRPAKKGRRPSIGLELQELSTALPAHTLPNFLQRTDFEYVRSTTGRTNTYDYTSTKARAIAAARKALAMGPVAVFATLKFGNQGVLALANELIAQIDAGIPLPVPSEIIGDPTAVDAVAEYLEMEYGPEWIGVRSLRNGAIVHHGDIPQETREVLEELLSRRDIAMVMCTSTLAEGVNLPIRTLVLYSVTRPAQSDPQSQAPMLARDIKNLVGRAGRAGSSTRGLVICANPKQWPFIRPVAAGTPEETVTGALIVLVRQLQAAIARNPNPLTNDILEETSALFTLVDGIDATLLELIRDEIGAEEFLRIAESVASATFAAHQADVAEYEVLKHVFNLRAQHMLDMHTSGQLTWARDTGARPRIVAAVVDDLYPRFANWNTVESPTDGQMLRVIIDWAFRQPGFTNDLERAYGSANIYSPASVTALIISWLEGNSYVQMATIARMEVDILLRVHTQVISHALATLVEQAVALLRQVSARDGTSVSEAVALLPDYLRYGVSSPAARTLIASGVRHRRAALALVENLDITEVTTSPFNRAEIATGLLAEEEFWIRRLGVLVYRRTIADLSGTH
ncbi:DEAD/DEAH box helicase [Nocardia sp. NPDC048505]|uniref:DEAD/DEAH box helicase n=1 Tax=unclassified Nocardia TaxID=2637762 RepID=UPI0033FC167A